MLFTSPWSHAGILGNPRCHLQHEDERQRQLHSTADRCRITSTSAGVEQLERCQQGVESILCHCSFLTAWTRKISTREIIQQVPVSIVSAAQLKSAPAKRCCLLCSRRGRKYNFIFLAHHCWKYTAHVRWLCWTALYQCLGCIQSQESHRWYSHRINQQGSCLTASSNNCYSNW